jgi:hypothetical protein
MIQSCLTGSLYARSETTTRVVTDLTLTLPTQTGLDVLATIALSGVAPGASIQISGGKVTGSLGIAACGIRYFIRMGSNGLLFGEASVGSPQHELRLTRCMAVTFRVAATLAEVYALARILILEPSDRADIFEGFLARTAVVYDPDDGVAQYVHVERRPRGVRAGNPRRFEREALAQAASALERSEASLRVAVVTGSDWGAGACRFDRRRKVITARPPAATGGVGLSVSPGAAVVGTGRHLFADT